MSSDEAPVVDGTMASILEYEARYLAAKAARESATAYSIMLVGTAGAALIVATIVWLFWH